MTPRLLLDENPSERLLPLLTTRFPDSQPIRLLGFGGADDHVLWKLARREGYVLVSNAKIFLIYA